MGRFLGLSALALLCVSANATLAVDYQPVTGVSQNGTCGDGVTCVGSGYGNCCSADGACGSTDEHCGDGCQPLFGICPVAVLDKRYANEYDEADKAGLFERALEERATSSACSSTSTASITCTPSKTSVIKAAETNPTSWCSSWLANRPHPSSPFVAQGILSPTGVSEACSCIIANPGSTVKATTTAKATTTSKAATTSKASTTLTFSSEEKAAATSTSALTCVATNIARIRTNRPSTDSWCTTWLANRPHPNSPFPKIPNPYDITLACQCILAQDASTSTSKTSTTTSKTSTTTSKTSTTTSKTSTTTSKTSTTTSKTSTTTSKTSTTTSKTSTTTSKASTTSKTSTSTKTSTTSTASACSIKKRRRRRDLHLATAPPTL